MVKYNASRVYYGRVPSWFRWQQTAVIDSAPAIPQVTCYVQIEISSGAAEYLCKNRAFILKARLGHLVLYCITSHDPSTSLTSLPTLQTGPCLPPSHYRRVPLHQTSIKMRLNNKGNIHCLPALPCHIAAARVTLKHPR
jgi:hypothetical protein